MIKKVSLDSSLNIDLDMILGYLFEAQPAKQEMEADGFGIWDLQFEEIGEVGGEGELEILEGRFAQVVLLWVYADEF